ncbi:GNAT family N-acetyltransferase [Paradevosia shaoguanensis]|uniref:GNAT family N-acetyltransferase n=1 Tax=Paradevosia shaoguanensis TaxID=1335043 RepID=A0AA41UDI0_9HYPH|nr:GNAT family N-acetyltransferase [Paradevosia shaoguanensis]MCF1744874.1 GNAT family N-acetyltransferase [Paradevosia shaoguanensis]MCI0129357.1 GNAT family N-acetyltransferase [Paradevosia shaoguanensis]
MSAEIADPFAAPLSVAGEAPSCLASIEDVPVAEWEALADRALETNAFFDPAYSRAAFSLAASGGGGKALLARAGGRLVALLPVVWASAAFRLPLPVLVARQPYSPLTAPLLAADEPLAAAEALLDAAAASGARLLDLPALPLDGAAGKALLAVLERRGIRPVCLETHERAALDAGQDAETYLRDAMGGKKLKELRRLRNRLDDEGAVAFALARTPDEIAAALERFLVLEASGWKGKGGTGLGQDAGDAAFVRAMAQGLGRRGAFEVLELTLDGRASASGLVMRQGRTAFFFKIAYDEKLSRFSPGVQLTLELTRQLCADEMITFADSTADAGHPMIDHIWRERLRVADMLVPLRANDPLAGGLILLLRLRRAAREQAKRIFRHFKSLREKRL